MQYFHAGRLHFSGDFSELKIALKLLHTEYEYEFYNNSPFPSGELQSKWICKICQEEQNPEVEPKVIMAKLVTKVEKLSTENCMFKKS